MNRTCYTEKCHHTSQKQPTKCRLQMLLCTHSMRDDPVFMLHLWETGKVSHLLRSSDIHSGIWQASPAQTYGAEIKRLHLLVRMRYVPFAAGRRRDIDGLCFNLHVKVSLCGTPQHISSFPGRCWLQQPTDESEEPGKHKPGMTNISPLCLHGNS